MSVPITARQMNALKSLQRSNPDIDELAGEVTLAFDAAKIDNPELTRAILEKTCRRICLAKKVVEMRSFSTLSIFRASTA